jgi:hypothetical protein
MKLTDYFSPYGNAKITYTAGQCSIMGVFRNELR